MIGSANTDEAEFPDADEVRFDREVNRHIAFGGGIHRCLGSHLARLELRVALREWHKRIPEYEVVPGHTLVYTAASAPSTTSRCASRRGRSRIDTPPPAVGHVLGPAALVPVAQFVASRRVRVPADGAASRSRRGRSRLARSRADRLSAVSSVTSRSASSTPRSRNSARARLPATSTWTVASPSGRCSGPWTRRMLCVFSRGTQVVARLRRPVTQTACAPSCPAERKWKLSGALRRARPGGAVRSGSGRAEQAGQEVPGVLLRPHGEQRLADDARALAPLVARRGARHVDFETAPPEGSPQQGLHLAHRLDPAVGHRLGDGLQQSAPDAHALGGLDGDEGELTREPAPDHAGGAEEVDGEEPRRGGRRLRFELVEHGQRGHCADEQDRDQ